MKRRSLRPAACRLRALVATWLVCSVAFALGLSAAPHLHEWLHKSGDRSAHECAATMLAAGQVENSACDPVPTEPHDAPSVHTLSVSSIPVIAAALEFSRLEHAPPVFS